MYRFFDTEVEGYADKWYERPIQQLAMAQQGPFTPTADGACLVQFDGDRLAYSKPRPGHPSSLMTAHEKIASDLAFKLGLPVPPLLVKEPCSTWPDYRAVSLVCLPASRTWGDGGHDVRETAIEALEALRVFWSWIADVDHAGHPGNLLYQRDDGKTKLAAIDHSYAFDRGTYGDPMATAASIGYGTAHDCGAPETRAAMIEKIASMPEQAIVSIVRRLGVILTGEQQDNILRLLFARQNGLAALLTNQG